jgi:hypothetical protein
VQRDYDEAFRRSAGRCSAGSATSWAEGGGRSAAFPARGEGFLAFFHHKYHTTQVKVVEKDKVISGLLQDELARCREMLVGLQKSVAALPRGVLRRRRKRYKSKTYLYYSLKYREGQKVINKHIRDADAPSLARKIEHRKKLEKEASAYRRRISYLSKILKAGKG